MVGFLNNQWPYLGSGALLFFCLLYCVYNHNGTQGGGTPDNTDEPDLEEGENNPSSNSPESYTALTNRNAPVGLVDVKLEVLEDCDGA